MRCRVASFAVLVCSLAALGGCGVLNKTADKLTGWFESGGAKPAPLPEIKESVRLSKAWSAAAGETGRHAFAPIADGEAVFIAGGSGKVARLDVQTGKEVWRIDTGKTLSAGVGAGAGLVLVGGKKGELIALNAATGAKRWEINLSSEVTGVPLVHREVVMVRTGDGRLSGLNPEDGSRKWLYTRQLPALTLHAADGMVASDGSVYAGFAGGKLAAIATSNGAQQWEATVSLAKGATELERVTDVVGNPVLDEKQVCAVSYQGRVACFERQKGSLNWARDTSSSAGLGINGQYVFVTDDKDAVTAYDKESGRAVWRQDKLANRRLTAPKAFGNYVVVADYEGYVHVLSKEDGGFVARAKAEGAGPGVMLVDIGPGFAVQTATGGVTAFKLD